MKTIELNIWTSLLLACIVAGLGSILPSFFNLAGYVSGIVYMIVAIVIMTTYRRKLWFKINNVIIEQKIKELAQSPDVNERMKKLKELNEDGGF